MIFIFGVCCVFLGMAFMSMLQKWKNTPTVSTPTIPLKSVKSHSLSSKTKTMRLVAFNTANYDDHKQWDQRLPLMVDNIVTTLNYPDVICLTEIRLNPDNPASSGNCQNMAEQMLQKLNEKGQYMNATLVTTPLMYYPYDNGVDQMYVSPASLDVSKKTHLWEGVALIVKADYAVPNMLTIYYNKVGSDNNRRGAQLVTIEVDKDTHTLMSICNTHFGLDEADRLSNASETLSYVQSQLDAKMPVVVCGDMNAVPTDPAMAMLTSSGKLEDCWTTLNTSAPGYTYPSNCPTTRIDYIYTSKNAITPTKMEICFDKPNAQGVYASDHVGVMVTMDVKLNA
eukprot:PhM_4_TR8072/c0_g1_i1/m.49592